MKGKRKKEEKVEKLRELRRTMERIRREQKRREEAKSKGTEKIVLELNENLKAFTPNFRTGGE